MLSVLQLWNQVQNGASWTTKIKSELIWKTKFLFIEKSRPHFMTKTSRHFFFFRINKIWDIKNTEEELRVNKMHIIQPHCWKGLVFHVSVPIFFHSYSIMLLLQETKKYANIFIFWSKLKLKWINLEWHFFLIFPGPYR